MLVNTNTYRHDDGDARNLAVAVELHLAHGKHGVGERRHEQTDRQLAWPVAEERLHDAR